MWRSSWRCKCWLWRSSWSRSSLGVPLEPLPLVSEPLPLLSRWWPFLRPSKERLTPFRIWSILPPRDADMISRAKASRVDMLWWWSLIWWIDDSRLDRKLWWPLPLVLFESPSQNRLCLLKLVMVENACLHLSHLIWRRQVACILLCLHKLLNCVYALRQTSHLKGLTLEWMCVCCFNPELVANVFPHSLQAWQRAPMCWERMWRWRFDGSVNTLEHDSQVYLLESSCADWWRIKFDFQLYTLGHWEHLYSLSPFPDSVSLSMSRRWRSCSDLDPRSPPPYSEWDRRVELLGTPNSEWKLSRDELKFPHDWWRSSV